MTNSGNAEVREVYVWFCAECCAGGPGDTEFFENVDDANRAAAQHDRDNEHKTVLR